MELEPISVLEWQIVPTAVWDHPYEYIRGKILAPFLGEFYGTCLENGEIKLRYDEDGFAVEAMAVTEDGAVDALVVGVADDEEEGEEQEENKE